MTRRDFELLAAALRAATPIVVAAVAAALASTNPRFDSARFLAAVADYRRAR